MTDLALQGTVIHVHKRYNAFEDLFNSLHRTLPVRSILTIYSPGCVRRGYSCAPHFITKNFLREPHLWFETRARGCLLNIDLHDPLPILTASTAPHHPTTTTEDLIGKIPVEFP